MRLLLILLFPQILSAFESELNELELDKVLSGEQIVHQELQANSPWPVVTIYMVIETDPEHSMAIFSAYDDQKNYIPNMLVSRPIAQADALQVEVEYELKMPWPLSNVRYIHDHKLSFDEDKKTYRLSWKMISSSSAEAVDGLVVMKPHGKRTLMKYQNAVKPKSAFASFVKGVMLDDVKESLKITREYIQKRAQNEQDSLSKKYLAHLRSSLAGEFVWAEKK